MQHPMASGFHRRAIASIHHATRSIREGAAGFCLACERVRRKVKGEVRGAPWPVSIFIVNYNCVSQHAASDGIRISQAYNGVR